MTDLATVRRKIGTAALSAFRRIPGPLKRGLVRAGTPNYTVGAVCAIEHDGAVLLLSQPHREGWTLPGGLLEHGEAPRDAVIREVREETGVSIDPGDHIAVGIHPHTQSIDVIFRAVAQQRPDITLSHEARRCRWWDIAEVRDIDRETRQILDLLRGPTDSPRIGRVLSSPADGD